MDARREQTVAVVAGALAKKRGKCNHDTDLNLSVITASREWVRPLLTQTALS